MLGGWGGSYRGEGNTDLDSAAPSYSTVLLGPQRQLEITEQVLAG